MQDVIDRVTANPKFLEFVAVRNRYSIIMTIVSAAAYYGFILLVAFKGPWLGTKLGAGMTTSIGVPIGVGVIVFTIILTWVYVRRANGEFDTEAAEILHLANK